MEKATINPEVSGEKYYPESIEIGMPVLYHNEPAVITKILPADGKGHYRTGFDIVVYLDDVSDKITLEALQFIKKNPAERVLLKEIKLIVKEDNKVWAVSFDKERDAYYKVVDSPEQIGWIATSKTPDYKSYGEHLEEAEEKGLPTDTSYMVRLAKMYGTPVPLNQNHLNQIITDNGGKCWMEVFEEWGGNDIAPTLRPDLLDNKIVIHLAE